MPEFKEWESFYVLVGSAAGALIGLQFVVLTLIAERPSLRSEEGGAAFSSPVVFHFGVALFIAALMSAPWRSTHVPRVVLGGIGLCGLLYGIVIVRHMRAQTAYKPVFADWAYNVALPVVAYATLVVSAIMANSHAHEAPFGVAAAALLLLFVGIHNSWDAISYHALAGKSDSEREE